MGPQGTGKKGKKKILVQYFCARAYICEKSEQFAIKKMEISSVVINPMQNRTDKRFIFEGSPTH